MIHAVLPTNRNAYSSQIEQMHHQRYDVFVKRFEWDLPDCDHEAQYEKDQFDRPDTTYLMALQRGEVLGGLRLLPTTKPHLMSDIFPHLCMGEVPTGPTIFEMSRGYVHPKIIRKRWDLVAAAHLAALYEYGLLMGIEQITCQSSVDFVTVLLGFGMNVRPLGVPVPTPDGKDAYVASIFDVTPSALQAVRDTVGFTRPVLEPILSESIAA